MIKIIKSLKKLLIIGMIPLSFILALELIPTSYDITVPAIVTDVSGIYQFDGISTVDVNVKTVSVLSYSNVSIMEYFIAKTNPFAVIDKHNNYVNTSLTYEYASGTIQKNVSLTNALIAAYTLAEKEINYTFNGYIVHSIYGSASKYFKLGDVIYAVEGTEVTRELGIGSILGSVYGYDEETKVVNIDLNTDYHFSVLRNGEKMDITAHAFEYVSGDSSSNIIGISYYPYFTIKSASPSYQITSPDTIGPSGGLMQALFIYDAITGANLTKNLNIIGTGTIDDLGTAGIIGGIEAKIACAKLNNCDVFFVPVGNYEDALTMYNRLHPKMKLVAVTSLTDVINYLKEYQAS